MTAATLVELLDIRAQEPDRPAYSLLTGEDLQQESISYRQLRRAARGVAAAITWRAGPGARIVLAYPPSLDFIVAFFGCLYAGAIAVPVYPPVPPNTKNGIRHLRAVVADSGAELALTSSGYLSSCALHPELETLPGLLPWLETRGTERAAEADVTADVTAGQPAFIQYTSGSTAQPKGVVLTHRNLMANMAAIAEAAGLTADDVCVSWLPMYHDMGLIGCILEPLYRGFPCYLMSPLDFIRRPVQWLRAISTFGGTVAAAPNFGYDLCVKRISEKEAAGLDLSSWRVAFDGAEPVNPSTMRRFATKFGPAGFRSRTFLPCYGLAEGSLIVTGSERDAPPVTRWLDRARLAAGEVVSTRPASLGAVEIVSSGRPVGGAEVVIAHDEDRAPLPATSVGEIWVRGPSVGAGYWGRREQSAAVFGATLPGRPGGLFLRTGDLGFLADGELYVTGRVKDLIIVRGRNIYPQDVELAAQESHPRLRQGGGAAFTVGRADNEHLVLVQVAAASQQAELQELITAIRRDVYDSLQVQLDAVALIRPSALPKTSSGKIQRSRCRAAFLAGELNPVAEWRANGMAGDLHGLRHRQWNSSRGPAGSGGQVRHLGPVADSGSPRSQLFLLQRVGLPGRDRPAGRNATDRLAAGQPGGGPADPAAWPLRGPELLRRRGGRRRRGLGVEPDGRSE